jgi:sulfate adenylyltransferase
VTTPTTGPLPTVRPDDAAVGDLQLLLNGVRLPWAALGGHLPDDPWPSTPSEPTSVGPGARSPEVAVSVPADQVAQVLSSGGARLTDRELAPMARLVDPRPAGDGPVGDQLATTDGRFVLVRGRLEPMRRREAMLFTDRMRRPDQLAAPVGERVVVVASRPPLRGELTRLTSRSDDTLVLVPVEASTPDGVPPGVLMRCVEAAADVESRWATILPVSLVWRDARSDEVLAAVLARADGGDVTAFLGPAPAWRDVLDALADGEPVGDAVQPAVADELRRWRPPPHSRGLVVLFTGFSGSGKSTLARDLVQHICAETGRTVSLLDGDDVRRLLSSGLGFDRASRDLTVRRIGYVAAEVARHGGIAVCAPIAPYAQSREAVRRMVAPVGDLVLVHVSTPIEECERRDLKGLYAQARAGEVAALTGVTDPYDVPTDADLTIDTSAVDRPKALRTVVEHLQRGGWLAGPHAAEKGEP